MSTGNIIWPSPCCVLLRGWSVIYTTQSYLPATCRFFNLIVIDHSAEQSGRRQSGKPVQPQWGEQDIIRPPPSCPVLVFFSWPTKADGDARRFLGQHSPPIGKDYQGSLLCAEQKTWAASSLQTLTLPYIVCRKAKYKVFDNRYTSIAFQCHWSVGGRDCMH
jgi:hypothetical protein